MQSFGQLKSGLCAKKYALENDYIKLILTDFGASVVSIILKTPSGETDVALGFDSAACYETKGGYLGAAVGRVANRIANAHFTLDGKSYNLTQNDGKHHLHGGNSGLSYKLFDAANCGGAVTFSCHSPDGEDGYPAALEVFVTYRLKGAAIEISYLAKTDAKTPVSLTNHTYFNLNGHASGSILGHLLQINADKVTPTDSELIANGQYLDVKNSPFDFREPKAVGQQILDAHPMLIGAGGYDLNYCVNGKGFRRAAKIIGDKTGISMSVDSDADGVQLYCGNKLSASGKDGAAYGNYGGFCLETQSFPNAVNHTQAYGFKFLEKNQTYKTKTVYGFKWKN